MSLGDLDEKCPSQSALNSWCPVDRAIWSEGFVLCSFAGGSKSPWVSFDKLILASNKFVLCFLLPAKQVPSQILALSVIPAY